MDRGYLDFSRLHTIHDAGAFFVTRAKSTKFKRRYSHPVDRLTSNILCDQTGVLTIFYSSKGYPATLRQVVVKDDAGKKRMHFPHSLHEILQILSLTMFETTPINQLLMPHPTNSDAENEPKQLVLL